MTKAEVIAAIQGANTVYVGVKLTEFSETSYVKVVKDSLLSKIENCAHDSTFEGHEYVGNLFIN